MTSDTGGGTSVEELLSRATTYNANNPGQCWGARAKRGGGTAAELLTRLEDIYDDGGYVNLADTLKIFRELGFSGDMANHFKGVCGCRKSTN